VVGLDATAARTFGTLRNSMQRANVELVLTHVDDGQIRRLLAAHGVIDRPDGGGDGGCRSFPRMEEGMRYCEEQFLQVWATEWEQGSPCAWPPSRVPKSHSA
jgi:hypothetical protein